MKASTPAEAALLGAMHAYADRYGSTLEREIRRAFLCHMGHAPAVGYLRHEDDVAHPSEWGGLGIAA